MSLIAQAKVLRALQESKVSPVGSDKEIKVDVRVIAATNKNMQKEIEEGKFREDLYHRLSVLKSMFRHWMKEKKISNYWLSISPV
jgi:transcriptional regulator with GAF, ATPase, and Fis domain